MSQDTQERYAFEGLPLEPVAPGTSLLVAGDPFAGTTDVALRTLVGDAHDGALLFAIDDNGPNLVEQYAAVGGTFDRSRMAAIDCSGEEWADDNIQTVGSPSDLTGIGIRFSSLYEDLYDQQVTRVRTGLFSVSTLLRFTDEIQPVYRFLHTLTGRVRAADGFAACVVDASVADDRTVNSLEQPFDGRLDVRETDDGCDLRVRGLADQPTGWQSV